MYDMSQKCLKRKLAFCQCRYDQVHKAVYAAINVLCWLLHKMSLEFEKKRSEIVI